MLLGWGGRSIARRRFFGRTCPKSVDHKSQAVAVLAMSSGSSSPKQLGNAPPRNEVNMMKRRLVSRVPSIRDGSQRGLQTIAGMH